jgi:CubicO group peptidase (beta-lactamase class C family)
MNQFWALRLTTLILAVCAVGARADDNGSTFDHGQTLRTIAPGATMPFVRALDRDFPAIMNDYGTTAAVVLVVDHGRIVDSRVWGEAAPGQLTTRDSVFSVASLSKLVAAWGFMTLVDQGRVNLDAPVSTYLTSEQRTALPFDTSTITSRQLLSHTSGLSGHSAGEYWPGQTLPSMLEELSARGASGEPNLRLTHPPGSEWAYSGAGYGLLQIIAENVSGKPFSQFMRDTVLRPLRMTHSFYGNPETEVGRTVAHIDEAGRPVARLGYANLAAAGLYTTLADFTKFVLADLNGGTSVLAAGDVTMMETAAPGTAGRYGLGYFVERLDSMDSVVGHDGSDVGWNSMYRMVRSRKAAIVIFTNNSLGIAAYFPAMCGWYRSLRSDRTDYCSAMPQLVVQTLYRDGEEPALARNASLARIDSAYNFSRPYWNYIGYSMLERHASGEAVPLFRLLTRLYPTNASAFDSLGDGYRAAGDRDNAIASYTRALRLDPTIQTSRNALRQLGVSIP